MHGLLQFLKMENNPNKHWTNTSGWSMVGCMTNVVLVAHKMTIQIANYIFVSCDELITIDNHTWISMHTHVLLRILG
jgi:hypothetical protein